MIFIFISYVIFYTHPKSLRALVFVVVRDRSNKNTVSVSRYKQKSLRNSKGKENDPIELPLIGNDPLCNFCTNISYPYLTRQATRPTIEYRPSCVLICIPSSVYYLRLKIVPNQFTDFWRLTDFFLSFLV